jgi:hypothetical protein
LRAFVAPDQIPDLAQEQGAVGVAWTYNEPFIWYEYIMDAGRRVKEAGLINVLVTNGYVNPEPLKEMRGLIDAMNIDLKAIDDSFYRKNCKGRLDRWNDPHRRLKVPRGSHQPHYSGQNIPRRYRSSRRFIAPSTGHPSFLGISPPVVRRAADTGDT